MPPARCSDAGNGTPRPRVVTSPAGCAALGRAWRTAGSVTCRGLRPPRSIRARGAWRLPARLAVTAVGRQAGRGRRPGRAGQDRAATRSPMTGAGRGRQMPPPRRHRPRRARAAKARPAAQSVRRSSGRRNAPTQRTASAPSRRKAGARPVGKPVRRRRRAAPAHRRSCRKPRAGTHSAVARVAAKTSAAGASSEGRAVAGDLMGSRRRRSNFAGPRIRSDVAQVVTENPQERGDIHPSVPMRWATRVRGPLRSAPPRLPATPVAWHPSASRAVASRCIDAQRRSGHRRPPPSDRR